MTDIHIIVVKDRFQGKHVIFFETGELGRPIMLISAYEFEKLIIKYKEDSEDLK